MNDYPTDTIEKSEKPSRETEHNILHLHIENNYGALGFFMAFQSSIIVFGKSSSGTAACHTMCIVVVIAAIHTLC